MRPFHAMDRSQRAAIYERWLEGRSFSEIGRDFGVSGRAVSYMLIREGFSTVPADRCQFFRDRHGYICVTLPDGRRDYAHRLAAEVMLGRRLRPGEIVHHRDEVKDHNAPSNLLVLASHGEHRSLHEACVRLPCHFCSAPSARRRAGRHLCVSYYNHVRHYHEGHPQCIGRRRCRLALRA